MVFVLILILGILIPTSIFISTGLAFVQYVRGAGKGTLLIFETLRKWCLENRRRERKKSTMDKNNQIKG